MTTQVAHLVHTRFQHRNRRLTCGVTLAAATFVAVVLILATTASANATGPCDGLSTVAVTATGSGTTSGSSVAPSANCSFSVDVTPPASSVAPSGSDAIGPSGATALEPCTATATPISLGSGGAKVRVETRGDCDGVELRATIDIGGSASPSAPNPQDAAHAASPNGASSATSWSYSAVRSKLTAWHFRGAYYRLPTIKMFWHQTTVTWSHTLNRVRNGSLSSDYWEGGCGRSLDSESRRTVSGRLRYIGEYSSEWSAGCFILPDATARAVTGVIARGGGAHQCIGHATFSGGLPGFSYEIECTDF